MRYYVVLYYPDSGHPVTCVHADLSLTLYAATIIVPYIMAVVITVRNESDFHEINLVRMSHEPARRILVTALHVHA